MYCLCDAFYVFLSLSAENADVDIVVHHTFQS